MTKTRKLTTMALLTAVSVVLVMITPIKIIHPIEYDAGNIPILISGFLFGPWAGLAVTLVASVVQGLTVSAASGPWGILMHFLSTSTFVVVSSLIYQKKRTIKRAVIGLACGAVATVIIMIPLNLIIMPLWTGNAVGTKDVVAMLMPVIIPANAIKVAINGVITFLIYKPISSLVKLPERRAAKKSLENPE